MDWFVFIIKVCGTISAVIFTVMLVILAVWLIREQFFN